MDNLLKFMYHGEVHIGQDQLSDFLKTAHTLQVRGLAEVSPKDQHKLISVSVGNNDNVYSEREYNTNRKFFLPPQPSTNVDNLYRCITEYELVNTVAKW